MKACDIRARMSEAVNSTAYEGENALAHQLIVDLLAVFPPPVSKRTQLIGVHPQDSTKRGFLRRPSAVDHNIFEEEQNEVEQIFTDFEYWKTVFEDRVAAKHWIVPLLVARAFMGEHKIYVNLQAKPAGKDSFSERYSELIALGIKF